MVRYVTRLDLVSAVAERARSEEEVIATVAYMLNGGDVCLCGTLIVFARQIELVSEELAA